MIENACLYFPVNKIAFKKVLPAGTSDGGFFRAASWYQFNLGMDQVRLTQMGDDLQQHLAGMVGYVSRMPNSAEAIAQAQHLLRGVKSVVNVALLRPIEAESDAFRAIIRLLERHNGFMFVDGNIMLPDGTFLVGPKAPVLLVDGRMTLQGLLQVNPDDYRHQGDTFNVTPDRLKMREQHYCMLAERGFECSRWLPINRPGQVRPHRQIVARAMAIKAIYCWAADINVDFDHSAIQNYVERNNLQEWLETSELPILHERKHKAVQEYSDLMSGKIESLWSLAWMLGYEYPPSYYGGQLPDDFRDEILWTFLPGFDTSVNEVLAQTRLRADQKIIEAEDIFYCAHNAVESARNGLPTVPKHFDPNGPGKAIVQRRHALSWALAPDSIWERTDLST